MGTRRVYEVPTRRGGRAGGAVLSRLLGRKKREIEEEREDVSVREGPAALSLIDSLGPPPLPPHRGLPTG